jgi:Flp pilus assembly protein TadG
MRRRDHQPTSQPVRLIVAASQRLRDERGAAMVEFAILVTVLLIIIVGIIFFGRFLNYSIDENHLANEAARWAAVAQVPSNCTTSLADCVKSQAAPELRTGSTDVPTAVKVCVQNGTGGSGNVGDPVTVTVTSVFHFLPLLGIADITDQETATMRLEQPPTASTVPIMGCA